MEVKIPWPLGPFKIVSIINCSGCDILNNTDSFLKLHYNFFHMEVKIPWPLGTLKNVSIFNCTGCDIINRADLF